LETIAKERGDNTRFRISKSALSALQIATEEFMTDILHKSYFASLHCKRTTLMAKDLHLIVKLRDSVFFHTIDWKQPVAKSLNSKDITPHIRISPCTASIASTKPQTTDKKKTTDKTSLKGRVIKSTRRKPKISTQHILQSDSDSEISEDSSLDSIQNHESRDSDNSNNTNSNLKDKLENYNKQLVKKSSNDNRSNKVGICKMHGNTLQKYSIQRSGLFECYSCCKSLRKRWWFWRCHRLALGQSWKHQSCTIGACNQCYDSNKRTDKCPITAAFKEYQKSPYFNNPSQRSTMNYAKKWTGKTNIQKQNSNMNNQNQNVTDSRIVVNYPNSNLYGNANVDNQTNDNSIQNEDSNSLNQISVNLSDRFENMFHSDSDYSNRNVSMFNGMSQLSDYGRQYVSFAPQSITSFSNEPIQQNHFIFQSM